MDSCNLGILLDAPHVLTMKQRDIPVPNRNEVLLAVQSVGICGSDIHLYKHGSVGSLAIRPGMILGHEGSGLVIGKGEDVKHIQKGDRVAIEPGIPCRKCKLCTGGRYNLCPDMTFLSHPPFDGLLQRYVTHPADLCFKLTDNMTFEEGALMEPLSVVVFACRRARIVAGDKVLICGSGPIGLLALMAVKAHGASEVVVTDVDTQRLEMAKELGADVVVNVAGKTKDEAAKSIQDTFGGPDKVLECTGVVSSVESGILVTNPGGVVALIGMEEMGEKIDISPAFRKEVDVVYVYRYADCFADVIDLVSSGKIDVKKLITHRFSLEEFSNAFETVVSRRENALKVIINCN